MTVAVGCVGGPLDGGAVTVDIPPPLTYTYLLPPKVTARYIEVLDEALAPLAERTPSYRYELRACRRCKMWAYVATDAGGGPRMTPHMWV